MKYFIGYNNNKEIRPLCIFSPEMSTHKRCCDKTTLRCFMIKDEKDFYKYMKILEKVSNIIKQFAIKNFYIIKNI